MLPGGLFSFSQADAAAYWSGGLERVIASRAFASVMASGAISTAANAIGTHHRFRLASRLKRSRIRLVVATSVAVSPERLKSSLPNDDLRRLSGIGVMASAAKTSVKAGKYSTKRRDLNNIRPNTTLNRNAVSVGRSMRLPRQPSASAPSTNAASAKPEFSTSVQVSYGYHSLPTGVAESPIFGARWFKIKATFCGKYGLTINPSPMPSAGYAIARHSTRRSVATVATM